MRRRGNDRTITTLHTETDHIFTASATHWIPTCWDPVRWLQGGKALPTLPGTVFIPILLTVSSPEAVSKNTLGANSEWLQDTNGGGRDFHTGRGTRRNGAWRQDAPLGGGEACYGAQDPRVTFFFLFKFLEYMETSCF